MNSVIISVVATMMAGMIAYYLDLQGELERFVSEGLTQAFTVMR